MAKEIRVLGFPTSILEFKLRRFIEKHSGSNTVDHIDRRHDGETVIYFKNAKHCQQFMDSGLDKMEYGGEMLPLSVLTRNEIEEQRSSINSKRENRNKFAVGSLDIEQTQAASKRNEPWHCVTDLKKTYYWHTMNQLPAPGGTKCVIVQNIDPAVHHQNIIMHFENRKRSNGGPVKCILKFIDGILVVFENSSDSDQVLSKVDQTFEGKLLEIYPKAIPMFYENKFVVSGVGETTSKHTLELFLEKCSKDEATPEFCGKQEMTGVYLLEYGDDFDSSETDSLMSKVNREPLEDHKLSVSRLLRSDCLKIGNIPANTSNDEIRLLFESRKRTGGGPVTKISKIRYHRLIYFALFEDAERIFDKYKPPTTQKIFIKENQLTVEIYHHSLANDHLEENEQTDFQSPPEEGIKNATVKPFHYSLEQIDKSIVRLIQNRPYHSQKLQDAFKDIASVRLLSGEKCEIRCSPVSGKSKKDYRNQGEFEKECQKHSEDFFPGYVIKHESFNKQKLSTLRVHKLFPFMEKDYEEENGKVIQYWEKETIFVTGLKDDVKCVIDKIRECMNFTVADMEIDDEQYRKLVHCGIIEEIKEKLKDVKLIMDRDKKKITVIGPQDEVSSLQIWALTMLNSVKRKKLAEMDLVESRKVFFRDYYRKESSQKHLEELFQNKNLKTCFIYEENEFEFFMRTNNFHELTKLINDIIAIHAMCHDGDCLLRSLEWKTFQQQIETDGKVKIFNQPKKSILLVGLPNEVRCAIKKIEKFFNENMTIEKIVSANFGSAIFALKMSGRFTPDRQNLLSVTECRLTSQLGGGIYIKVKKCNLEKAVSELKATLQDVVRTQHKLYDTGLNEYFKTEQGKEFLKNTENILRCIILTSADPQTWPVDKHMITDESSLKQQSIPSERPEKLASVKLPGSGAALQVWKDDIIKHKSDIIVNESNPELGLLCKGVSGVIRSIDEKNGNIIQKEMRKIIQRNSRSILPGDAEITTSGQINNCKKIIHAVGPRWNQAYKYDSKLILKACISQVLTRAESTGLRTIAIPAISCDNFGGKVHECVPLIVEATVDYFAETPQSCIKEVHFIENNKEIALKEFLEQINLLQTSTPTTTTNPPVVPSSALSIKVSLVQGNIADQISDAIVNITQLQSNFMQGSAISKALAVKAGQNIEAQVILPTSNGKVVETSAGQLSCKKLYHGFVTRFNSQDAELNVRSIVSNCLKNAETAQYRSMAFPAIATGGFQHPPNLVAKWMKDEISKFRGTSLQNVTIVLFPKNQKSISAFNAEFNPSQMMSNVSPSIPFQTVDSSSVSIGPLTVSVYQGDITEQKSDAIVNSTNQNFDFSQGMISKSIVSKGGPKIQAEASSAAGTDLRVTNGGNLACKYIYHIVANSKDKIQTVLTELMELAEKKQHISSVSIPALGTGNIGLPSSSVANAMRKALEKFASNHPTTTALRKINVVVFDKTALPDFKNGLLKSNNADVQNGVMAKVAGTVKTAFHRFWRSGNESTVEEKNNNPVVVYVMSTSEETNSKALQYIQDEINKVICTKLIEDETFGDLTEWEKWEIDQVRENHQVHLNDISNRYFKRIQVQGLTRNVLSANEAINKILQNFREAETWSQQVKWQRLMPTKTWDDYPSRANFVLEKAFKSFKRGKGSSKVSVTMYNQGTMSKHEIDLKDMDGQNPSIRRILKEEIPKHWDDMGNEQCKKVVLSSGSPEYNEILTNFRQTMSSSITQIERIQHIPLYKQYAAKKAEVMEKLNNCGSKNVAQRRLFHGTDVDDKIIDNGFDRSYVGKHGNVYGRGVYFAVKSEYSNRYTQPDTNGNRRMFLADVITGDYCLGSAGHLSPPARAGGMKNDLYDSTVNNMEKPEIFVIFKDASAYPTYLITYKSN